MFSYEQIDTPDILLAQNDAEIAVTYQESLPEVSLAQCQQLTVSEDELEKNLITPPAQNENVGRYVGFGRHEFKKGNSLFRL